MRDTFAWDEAHRAGADTAVIAARPVNGGRGPVTPLTLLRITAALTCLDTVVQGLLAGMLLNGDVASIDPHGVNAYVFELLVFLQLVAAVLLWHGNRGLTWPVKGAAGILAVTFGQTGLGLASSLAAHVALGVALCAMQTVFALFVVRGLTFRTEGVRALRTGSLEG
ncbi:hypothetical protein GT044_21990 [Streptomyces sp. SID335]|nr:MULTISPECIES: hypothetical protein [unclassified Streptomyces]NEA03446.1 hypothetical protein [Streptomyces sp. SID10116]MYY83901.1 hypothetical protein [Streptomyces sp. SID335]NDZ84103.1 hypothetical protein [Streptomyces sp. SID10115]NEA05971.1 hypothetical protein [Streptomyces sp. SID10116]NEB44688.1 hypothetical protein [Streptomyces sp. SID339]